MSKSSHIVGVGAFTAVGACSAISAAAVRARIARIALDPLVEGDDDSEVHVARASALAPELSRTERMRALLHSALEECVANVSSRIEAPLFLCSPPDVASGELVRQGDSNGLVSWSSIQALPAGHAGGLIGLERALGALDSGAVELACVAGVDCRADPGSLGALSEADRLLGNGNRWGFVAGEAGGALLLASEAACKRLELFRLGRIRAVGHALESTVQSGEPCIGRALTTAWHAALAPLPAADKVGHIFCDLNSERPRTDEWGYTAPRVRDRCVDPARYIAPAICWGDVGSATGPLLVQLALASFARGWAVGRHAVAWAASEGPERAVVLIERADAALDASDAPQRRTGLAAPTSGRHAQAQQNRAMLEELVAESVFFYELRGYHQRRLEQEPEHNAAALESIEERLEAHFDGASLDTEAALRICAESGEDAGSLYVATRLLAATGQAEALMRRLSEVDLAQGDAFRAVHDALSHSAGPHAAKLVEPLVLEDGPLRALGLWLAGDCGPKPSVAWSQLARTPVESLGASLPWALGRLAGADQAHQLEPWLESRELPLAEAAALAYLRLDRVGARRYLQKHRTHPGFLLALCSTSEPSDEWIALAKSSDDPARGCLALALIGTGAAVDTLLEYLTNADRAAYAARALHLVTGLEPLDSIERRERLDDELLTDDELDRRRAGDVDVGVDRVHFTRFTQDRTAWERSLHARPASTPTPASRMGSALDATSCIHSLGHARVSPNTRGWIADELAIRFSMPLPLRSRPRVADYARALTARVS